MRVARTRPPIRPAVRLRAAPPLDPPFDDEPASSVWLRDPGTQLTLSLPTRPAGRRRRPVPVGRRGGPGGADGPPGPCGTDGPLGVGAADWPPGMGGADGPFRAGGAAGSEGTAGAGGPGGGDAEHGPAALPPGALATASPEARQAARRFLGTCLEILNGYRPVAQIRPLASPAHATEIIEQLTAAVARAAAPRHPAARTARGFVRLRRMRVCEPRPGVAEAAAALGVDDRTWALPFRLERRRGGWVGTEVRLL
jgi:hypothetical protein